MSLRNYELVRNFPFPAIPRSSLVMTTMDEALATKTRPDKAGRRLNLG
jgi:hypothetical protein